MGLHTGVPDATTIKQIHGPASPLVGDIFRSMQGEDYVEDVSRLSRVVVRDPDVTSFDPILAPDSRVPMVAQAFTVRPFGREQDGRLRGEKDVLLNVINPDPLQEMENAGISRGNTFRTPPDPWDENLYA